MVVAVVEGTEASGHIPAAGLADDPALRAQQLFLADGLGTPVQVRVEIDSMAREVREVWSLEPDQAMRLISAFSARLTELYILLHRVEGKDRSYRQIRTQEVVPLLSELDRQFKIASRYVEVRRQDLETMR